MTEGSPYLLGYEKGRADAIRELTEWRTGEPPEGLDNVLVRATLDGEIVYRAAKRFSINMWMFKMYPSLWDSHWQWREIPL